MAGDGSGQTAMMRRTPTRSVWRVTNIDTFLLSLLVLGPVVFTVNAQSAGAAPGPVCYGFGGVEPTLADALAVLERLVVWVDRKVRLVAARNHHRWPIARPYICQRQNHIALSTTKDAMLIEKFVA